MNPNSAVGQLKRVLPNSVVSSSNPTFISRFRLYGGDNFYIALIAFKIAGDALHEYSNAGVYGSGHLKAYLENVEIYLFNGICKVLVSFLGSERKVATTVHEPRDAESNAKAFRTLRVPTNNKHFEQINGNLLRTGSASFTGYPGVRDLLGRHLHEQLLVTGVREFWTVGVFSTFS